MIERTPQHVHHWTCEPTGEAWPGGEISLLARCIHCKAKAVFVASGIGPCRRAECTCCKGLGHVANPEAGSRVVTFKPCPQCRPQQEEQA